MFSSCHRGYIFAAKAPPAVKTAPRGAFQALAPIRARIVHFTFAAGFVASALQRKKRRQRRRSVIYLGLSAFQEMRPQAAATWHRS
jgi:hypothetical protein